MKKVIVLGCPGSGKSYFSKKLHEIIGIPLFHLDNIWWQEDITHISREEFDIKLDEILLGEEWIIDGDYSRTYEKRMEATETIFFLDFPIEVSLDGISERVGKKRSDNPFVEEIVDPELIDEIHKYHLSKRGKLTSLLDKYSDKEIHIFHSRKESDDFLKSLNG